MTASRTTTAPKARHITTSRATRRLLGSPARATGAVRRRGAGRAGAVGRRFWRRGAPPGARVASPARRGGRLVVLVVTGRRPGGPSPSATHHPWPLPTRWDAGAGSWRRGRRAWHRWATGR